MLLLSLFLIALAGFFIFHLVKSRRRKQLLSRPFPEEWDAILKKNFPIYRKLPGPMQKRLHPLIHVFIGEKSFEGCGGLEVTEEMKVTIAGQACLLILNAPKSHVYPKLRSILIYPTAFKTDTRSSLFHFLSEEEDQQLRLGESWSTGSVILAWDNVLHGAHDWKDGHNLVFHEFAHQLDQSDGSTDGAPKLGSRSRYLSWARVLGKEFETLEDRVQRNKKTFFDQYGATDPAEFFAVVTETFFEKPKTMKKKYPELYEEFRKFYRLDPVDWKWPEASQN
ncbi:MAG: M90 family metallopeptidase [Verrucomicrobiota bacterium]